MRSAGFFLPSALAPWYLARMVRFGCLVLAIAGSVLLLAPRPAPAGCSSAGCARIDWTQVSESPDGEIDALGLHGVFATAAPGLAWGWIPLPGTMTVRCPAPVEAECRVALDELFEAAASRVPLLYDAGDAFDHDGVVPLFIAVDGSTAETVTGGEQWPVPVPGDEQRGICRSVYAQAPIAAPCPGDCDGDGQVTVEEVVRCVRTATGAPGRPCPGLDASGDGLATVDEVVGAVRRALDGCPAAG